MSYLTAFLFVLSLIYYLGYFYGLGIPPSSIPLTVIDITNGICLIYQLRYLEYW
ncbi:protein of unknown function [Legionella micdadei]|uniref:Uncharacterized protein n=1 Tax=Legionella micdadei TaxID=451 RepID=A0A098GJL1_LEGMI|nr:protein of unknown function [Legionella micdadei]